MAMAPLVFLIPVFMLHEVSVFEIGSVIGDLYLGFPGLLAV